MFLPPRHHLSTGLGAKYTKRVAHVVHTRRNETYFATSIAPRSRRANSHERFILKPTNVIRYMMPKSPSGSQMAMIKSLLPSRRKYADVISVPLEYIYLLCLSLFLFFSCFFLLQWFFTSWRCFTKLITFFLKYSTNIGDGELCSRPPQHPPTFLPRTRCPNRQLLGQPCSLLSAIATPPKVPWHEQPATHIGDYKWRASWQWTNLFGFPFDLSASCSHGPSRPWQQYRPCLAHRGSFLKVGRPKMVPALLPLASAIGRSLGAGGV